MKISTEDKKVEAVRRMKLLGIYPETIQQFDKECYVSLSEPPFGAYFWVQGEELEKIRDFEQKYNALVYTVIRGRYLEIRTLDAYLYVSDEKSKWEYDEKTFGHGEIFAYVYSQDFPDIDALDAAILLIDFLAKKKPSDKVTVAEIFKEADIDY